MIYFSSDLHFGHNKDFIYKARGFNDIDEHNNRIILNFHRMIKPEDDLYLLGDTIMGDSDQTIKLFHQLPGKIHLIWGNHDTLKRQEMLEQTYNVVEVLGYAHTMKIGKQSFYLSHYPTLIGNYDNDKPLKRRVINLCGHTHTTDKFADYGEQGIIYHCEVDAHEMYPVSIDEIMEDIKKKVKEV